MSSDERLAWVVSNTCGSCGKRSVVLLVETTTEAVDVSDRIPDRCPKCGNTGFNQGSYSVSIDEDFVRKFADLVPGHECSVCRRSLLFEDSVVLNPGSDEMSLPSLLLCADCERDAAPPRLLAAVLEWMEETEKDRVTLYGGFPLADIDRAVRSAIRQHRGDA